MDEAPSARRLLDHTQDMMAVLDPEGRITYVNATIERMLGYDPATLVGETAFEYVHPDEERKVRTAFEWTISSETVTEARVEYRCRASDGSWVWLESQMSNRTHDDLDGYVVSSRDISNRISAERDQQATVSRLEQLAATTGDVLWMFDADWSELLFINPAFEDVYGRSIDELEGDPLAFLETVHPEDVPMVETAMERLSAGESVDMEYRVNPDEDYGVWVWVQATPIVEDGEVVRITGFTRDVTDRRRRERQLYVMDNLLRHNLRNDLTTIIGNADLIDHTTPQTTEQTATIRQTAQDLLASAEKERRIIDLLTTDVSRQPRDVGELVDQSVAVVDERFPAATIDVSSRSSGTVVVLDELRFALVELLENAIQHSDSEQPSVRISLSRTDTGVRVVIADDGPPIPDIEARVLTGDHEMDEVYHSSGLGLWLVYWVVELSDGEITVTPGEDEGGNRIRLTLPRES